MASPRGAGPSAAAVSGPPSHPPANAAAIGWGQRPTLAAEPEFAGTRDQWLQLHADDLVERMQRWAADLDAREAQLNARASLQDHRERRARLEQQELANELAEQERSIERLRKELEAQARRLAFRDEPAV
jgi:hypothetical protein